MGSTRPSRALAIAAAGSIAWMWVWCGGAPDDYQAVSSSSSGGQGGNDGAATPDTSSRPPAAPYTRLPLPACPAHVGCKDGFCLVPAGTFTMGSPPDEFGRGRHTEEQSQVTYTHALAVQQTEMTQQQWEGMGFPNLAGTVDDGTGGTDCVAATCPASTMTWCEAAEFANRLSTLEGRTQCMELINPRGTVGHDFQCDGTTWRGTTYYDCDGYRLPTSGEWEYAARAGTQTTFFSGPFENASDTCYDLPHLSRVAWYCANAGGHSHPVCTKEANPWGLHDVHGNIAEFTVEQTRYGYGPDPAVDPPVIPSDNFEVNSRLVRDSPWLAFPWYLRAANQALSAPIGSPLGRSPGQGIRLVRTLSAAEAAAW